MIAGDVQEVVELPGNLVGLVEYQLLRGAAAAVAWKAPFFPERSH